MRIALYLALGWVSGWFLEPIVYGALNDYIKLNMTVPKGVVVKEIFLHATEPFMLKLKLAFMIGLALTIPLVVRELWGFVSPGLKPKERKPFKFIMPVSLFLFALGS